jgi:iron complex transport system substrate-binding protein
MKREVRIASLAPAGTEMVYLLGAEAYLVGVSQVCDHPPAARKLPQLTRTLIDDAAPSDQIDAEVQRRLREGLPLYEIDIERLNSLAPTLILAQSQCSVCAVDVQQAEALQIPGASVFAHGAQSLEEMLGECERLADRLHDAGSLVDPSVIQRLRSRCEGPQGTNSNDRPRVLIIEWLEPLMSAGNWTPDLIERAGGESLLATFGHASPYIEWQNIIDADPDILIIAPCGFDLARTCVDAQSLRSLPGWSDLSAIKNRRAFLADGNGLFHRCGPRLADTLELLRAILNNDHQQIARFAGLAERWNEA